MDSNPYTTFVNPVASAAADVRATFIKKTYTHLAGAIFAFLVLSILIQKIPGIDTFAHTVTSGYMWLGVIALWMGASYMFDRIAHTAQTMQTQYLALGGFVVLEAALFSPLLYFASHYAAGVLPKAAVITLFLFSGLTLVAFTTKADFSFMASAIKVGAMIGLGLIVANIVFVQSSAMSLVIAGGFILIAGGSILYQTSTVMRSYPADRYVGASLGLFASVALMFWYVVILLMNLSSD